MSSKKNNNGNFTFSLLEAEGPAREPSNEVDGGVGGSKVSPATAEQLEQLFKKVSIIRRWNVFGLFGI